jgi:alpha-N-arabinofuranosidase
LDQAWSQQIRRLVTTELLGKATVPNLPFENRDGSAIRLNTDYFGKKRNEANPFPGPFEFSGKGNQLIKVWN